MEPAGGEGIRGNRSRRKLLIRQTIKSWCFDKASGGSAERPVFSADVLAMCEKQREHRLARAASSDKRLRNNEGKKKICHSGRASVGRLSPFLLSNRSRRCRWMQGARGGDKRRHDGYYHPPPAAWI